jgi:hypothetical protein
MSTRYTYDLGDSDGNSFKVSIVVPWAQKDSGSWRSIDKGFIRYSSGSTYPLHPEWFGDDHLLLFSSDGTWGIQLFKYRDWSGVNDQGTGRVLQPWVMTLRPGTISWAIV